MKIKIEELTKLSNEVLQKYGFSKENSAIITTNLIEAELANRKPHGLNKITVIKKVLNNKFDESSKYFDFINMDKSKGIDIIKESSNHLYLDSNFNSGYLAIHKALELSIDKAIQTSVFTVSIKNMGFASGFIGAYARNVAEHGLVYIGFHNSSGGLNYYGTNIDPLGTNPITIGLPSLDEPVVVDTSMAKLNWNDIEKAKNEGTNLPEGVAIDESGNDTIDPQKAFSVKSIEGHKGTALAYGVELLAGALSDSRVDFSNFGGWGSTFIIINPEFFVGLDKFKELVSKSILTINSFGENIFVPGQRSEQNRKNNLTSGYIDLDPKLYEFLQNELK